MVDFSASFVGKGREQTKLNTKFIEEKALSESQLFTMGKRKRSWVQNITKIEIPFKTIVQLSDLLAQLLEMLHFPMTSAVAESGRIA